MSSQLILTLLENHILIKSLTLIVFCIQLSDSAPVSSRDKRHVGAVLYLQSSGFINESTASNLVSEKNYSSAILRFKKSTAINQTELLDQATIQMIDIPRCGNNDSGEDIDDPNDGKRYALVGSKLGSKHLTYRISVYPTNFATNKQQIDREIAKAFRIWSEVTPLSFEAKKEGRVNIDIRFVSGEHGDGDPFDGPGNKLAHASYPQYGGGMAHFDNAEDWTISSYSGINLFQVAAHVFGHSLGLRHSRVKDSVMAPLYKKYMPRLKLHMDDILAIQALYGPKYTTDLSNDCLIKPSDSVKEPDLCEDSSIDGITRISDGTTFVFKGIYYWKLENTGLGRGYPRRIFTDWDGMPGNIDAVLTWDDGKTFFFKGGQYWRFKNMRMDVGYPKSISTGFPGIPNQVDAAFVWSGNGKTYFFKGDQYWKFDKESYPSVSEEYPQSITNWNGLPNGIDAAVKWQNGVSYFFKGSQYYRYNDAADEVDTEARPPFPRQIGRWWFDCQSHRLKNEKMDNNKNENQVLKDSQLVFNGGSDGVDHFTATPN